MTTKYSRLEIALVLGLGVFAGCAQDQNETQVALSKTESSSVEQSSGIEVSGEAVRTDAAPRDSKSGEWITMPARLRFPGVSSIETAPSWDARVAEFSQADQIYLSEVSDRYFGTLEFQDEAEQRHMVQQVFPMPEEWLAAHNLPTAELERLVEQGNVKAKMFYIDRVSQEIGPILARGDGLGTTPEDRALFNRLVRAKGMADELLQSSRSPFAAYLAARFSSASTFGNPPEVFAGAFEMARELGHGRAGELQGKYFASRPGMDASVVMASYSFLKQAHKR